MSKTAAEINAERIKTIIVAHYVNVGPLGVARKIVEAFDVLRPWARP